MVHNIRVPFMYDGGSFLSGGEVHLAGSIHCLISNPPTQELHSMLNAPSYGLNASLARQKQKEEVQASMVCLLVHLALRSVCYFHTCLPFYHLWIAPC